MNINLVDKKLNDIQADLSVVIILSKNLNHPLVQDKSELKLLGFEGADESHCYISNSKTLYVGAQDLDDLDNLRNACAIVSKFCLNKNFHSLKMPLYSGNNEHDSLKALAEGIHLGMYAFDKHLSKKSKASLKEVYISKKTAYSESTINDKDAQSGINEGNVFSKATIFTRDIVNRTPHDVTPKKMAKIALKMAKKYNLKATILNEKDMKKRKMGAFLAVSRASIEPPRLIHLSYKHKNAKKKVVLIGKGLTYDSGGLSLKPADSMITMKCDKAGGAAVLGIMLGVCEMKLPIDLDIVIGATENMIGGNAYKPDDVLIASNGKSIEVRNTDAEGRLVLADCLCYAQEQIKNFDYLFDYATLTGACAVGLGQYTSGVMGHNSKLKQSFETSGNNSGDFMNQLHFNKHLSKLIKSEMADVCNVASSRYGGSLTAGLFLDHFVEEKNKDKWLHIDIAGPAYVEKAWGSVNFGASGAGVRATLNWLKHQDKAGLKHGS